MHTKSSSIQGEDSSGKYALYTVDVIPSMLMSQNILSFICVFVIIFLFGRKRGRYVNMLLLCKKNLLHKDMFILEVCNLNSEYCR